MPGINTRYITAAGAISATALAAPPGLGGLPGPSSLVLDSLVFTATANVTTGDDAGHYCTVGGGNVTVALGMTLVAPGTPTATQTIVETRTLNFPNNTGPRFSNANIQVTTSKLGTNGSAIAKHEVTLTYHYE